MESKGDSIMPILSSSLGAGKTTITKKIQQKYQDFKISVSHKTRKPRPNEIEDIDYYFILNLYYLLISFFPLTLFLLC